MGTKIFEKNGIRFENADCMERLRNIPDKAFDLAIVDPPYRDAKDNAPFQQMRAASSNKELFKTPPIDELLSEIERVSKEQIIFGANNYGRSFKGFIAWDKCVRGSTAYSQVEIASLSSGLSTVSRLIRVSTYDAVTKVHPTQKPIDLYEWILKYYAKPEQTILDPMCGSASSLIAAYNLGFKATGYEIDAEYYSRACSRLEEYMAQIRFEL